MLPATVLVCRGCCCGTEKHLNFDHIEQLDRFRAAGREGSVKVWTTRCLGPCERSNVVVVRSAAGRNWFGDLADDAATRALTTWIAAGVTDPVPDELEGRRFQPANPPPIVARPLDLDRDAIAELIHGLLADGTGAWTFGVRGAAAEITTAGSADVRRSGHTVESVTDEGGVRIVVDPAVRAFVVRSPVSDLPAAILLATPRHLLEPRRSGLTPCGGDTEALRAADAAGHLFDLGIDAPSTSFCVRTADAELRDVLEHKAGMPLPELLDSIGRQLIEHSPHRVVRTPVGRAEVYAPIPQPDAASPTGPHTHLLPGELDLGTELSEVFTTPPGWASATIFHPPSGWVLP
jgi:hypothetical protein